jgi:drug/metabolite transporter (DMT)-like permease
MSKGVLHMMVATLFFALMNVCVKLIPHIPAVEIVFFRSLITLFLSYGFLKKANIPIWGNNKKLLILRGVSGSVSLILYFRLMQEIPLASANTLVFLAPIFTTILAIFMNNEKVDALQWVFFAISFAGVLFIRGFDVRISNFNLLMGILASLTSGIAFNAIRKLNTSEHPLVIMMYFPLVTIPFTGVFIMFNWQTPQGADWLILLAIGILTHIAQLYMTKAYQTEEVSKVSSVRYLGIIYALGFGFVFFDEHFNVAVYLGMALTLAGVILNVWYKRFKLKRLDSIFKGKLYN